MQSPHPCQRLVLSLSSPSLRLLFSHCIPFVPLLKILGVYLRVSSSESSVSVPLICTQLCVSLLHTTHYASIQLPWMGPSVYRPLPGLRLKFGCAPRAWPVVDLAFHLLGRCCLLGGRHPPGFDFAFPQVSSLWLCGFVFLPCHQPVSSLVFPVVYVSIF